MSDHEPGRNGAPLSGRSPQNDDAGTAGAADDSGDDAGFVEPHLGSAEISPDVARSVDLSEVEAEAARVAQEAEASAQLPASAVLGRIDPEPPLPGMPTPDAPMSGASAPDAPLPGASVPDGSLSGASIPDAPLPGVSGEDAAESGLAPAASEGSKPAPQTSRDGAGWHRPETPWQPRPNAWQSGTDSHRPGTPSVPGGTDAGREAAAAGGQGDQDWPAIQSGSTPTGKNRVGVMLAIVIGAIVILGLLIWLLITVVSGFFASAQAGRTPGATAGAAAAGTSADADSVADRTSSNSRTTDGGTPAGGTAAAGAPSPGAAAAVIQTDAVSLQWLEGDCLRGYTEIAGSADVVPCTSPHAAQLVGTFNYPDTVGYPGQAVLQAKARSVCAGVVYTRDAASFPGLKQKTAYPSESTWNTRRDRRIDCLVFDPGGDRITKPLTE